MAHETLQAIVGTAIVDSDFCHSLLQKSPDIARDFELTAEESQAIQSIHASTLSDFASQLHRWIVRSSTLAPVRY